jgi:hypothetical protein
MMRQSTWCFHEFYLLHLNKLISPKSYLFSYSIMNLNKDVNISVFYFHVFHSRGQRPFLD